MKPLYEYIIARPMTDTVTTKKGLLYVPETAKDDKLARGIVVAVGDGPMTEYGQVPLTVRVGDVVLYWKHAAQEIEYEGEKCMIMRECPDVVAYLTKQGEKYDK
jgi:chaperonin GroES